MDLRQILQNWGLEMLILTIFVLVLLPYGPGITFDTVSFFQAGDNFWEKGKYVHLKADGELVFAAHRFPLYPLIISIFNGNLWTLKLLQILIFLGFILSFRRLLNELNSPKYFFLFLVTFPLILNFYTLWTESLYALLFIVILIHLKKEEKFQSIAWLVILLILISFTRMVGIVVAVSFLISYFIEKRQLRGLTLFLIGVAPIVSWTLLGSFYLGETARTISLNPINRNDFWYLFVDVGNWLTPSSLEVIPLVTGICLFIFPIALALKALRDRSNVGILFWFLIIHFYAYSIFVLLSKALIDASIPFDFRTLFPLILNVLGLLVLSQVRPILTESAREKIRYIFPKIALLAVVLNVHSLWNLRNNGVGYNSKEWKSFEFIDELAELESDQVYTNDQSALTLFAPLLDGPALLPEKINLYTLEENHTYGVEFNLMLIDLNSSNGLIIWIRNGITANVYPSYEELQGHSSLEIIYDDWLCLILKLKE